MVEDGLLVDPSLPGQPAEPAGQLGVQPIRPELVDGDHQHQLGLRAGSACQQQERGGQARDPPGMSHGGAA